MSMTRQRKPAARSDPAGDALTGGESWQCPVAPHKAAHSGSSIRHQRPARKPWSGASRQNLLPRRITASAIAPCSVNTPMLHDPARAGLPILPLPFGRLLEANKVAALAQFLIGPDAGGISGQTHFVCGGASLPSLPAPRG